MSNIRPSVAPGEKTKFPRVHMGHMGREPTVEDEDIVDTLRDWPDGNVFPSTGTVTDELDADYDRKTVYRRLDKLEKAGEIEKIQVGRGRGKSVGWYAPEKVQEPGRPQEPERPSEGDNGTDEASPTEMDANTSGLSGRLSPPGGSMDLASVLILLVVAGTVGFVGLQVMSTVIDTTNLSSGDPLYNSSTSLQDSINSAWGLVGVAFIVVILAVIVVYLYGLRGGGR